MFAGGPFRQMQDVLGNEERELEATRELGVWTDRLRERFLLYAMLIGIALGGFGYAWCRVSDLGDMPIPVKFAFGFGGPWITASVIGVAMLRRIVRARRPEKLAQLAIKYGVERARLERTVALIESI